MRPARRSVRRPSGPAVAKFARAVTSPGRHADAEAHRLEDAPPHLEGERVVAEDGEVPGAAPRRDSGGDRDVAAQGPLARPGVEVGVRARSRAVGPSRGGQPPRPSSTTKRIFVSGRPGEAGQEGRVHVVEHDRRIADVRCPPRGRPPRVTFRPRRRADRGIRP